MAESREARALREALPPGTTVTHILRAEPRLRFQLFRIFGGLGGLLFLLLKRGARPYAIGFVGEALVMAPMPHWQNDPPVRPIPRSAITRLLVQNGAIRTKITLDTATEQHRLRVPGAAAHGKAREALAALAAFAAAPPGYAPIEPSASFRRERSPAGPHGAQGAAPYQPPTPGTTGGQEQGRLTVLGGTNVGQSFVLREQSGTGRHPANDIALADSGVSGQHARIERQPNGDFVVADLGSTNGTLLNGARLTEPRLLLPNDVLLFNETALRFD